MKNNDIVSMIKSYLLLALLVVTCVVLVTPISILDNLQPIIQAISEEIGFGTSTSSMIT